MPTSERQFKGLWQNFYAYWVWTVIFIITFRLAFHVFYADGASMIWQGDGVGTWYPNLHYRGRFLRELVRNITSGTFVFPMIDLRHGLGDDIFRNGNAVRFDVFSLLGIFVPTDSTETWFNWLIPLKFYLAGITMIAYLKQRKIEDFGTVVGALVYVFSGYNLFWGVRHGLMFLAPVIYLPLLLMGLERIFEKKSPILFIIVSFLFWLHGYYFYYMIGLFFIPYALIRIHQLYPGEFIKGVTTCGFKSISALAVSVLMASFYVLPQVIFFLSVPSRDSGIHTDSLLWYSWPHYHQLFMTLIGGWSNTLWFPGVFVVAVAWCSFSNNEENFFEIHKFKRKHLLALLIILTVIAMIPLGSLIFNAFAYHTPRWMFLLSFAAALVTAQAMSAVMELEKKVLFAALIVAMVYGTMIVIMPNYRNMNFYLGFISLLATIALLAIPIRVDKELIYKQRAVLVLVCLNIIIFANLRFSAEFGAMVNTHTRTGDMNGRFIRMPDYLLPTTDQQLFRIDLYGHANAPLIRDYFGLSMYSSIQNPYFLDFLSATELGGRANYFNIRGLGGTLGGTAPLNTLASVRYFITRSNTTPQQTAYGFVVGGGFQNFSILVNANYLPFGFTYTETISEELFFELDPVSRSEVMLSHLVLEDGSDVFDSTLLETRSIPFEIVDTHNFTWQEGSVSVSATNEMILSLSTLPNSESFVRIVGFGASHRNTGGFTITVNGQQFSRHVGFERSNYFSSRHHMDFLIPIGNWAEPITELTISIDHSGVYTLRDIQIFSMPTDNFSPHIDALREYTLQNLTLLNYSESMPGLISGITGEVSIPDTRYLYISIPYSSGWRAWVNGVRTPVLRANVGFMAVELPPGNHFVELRYRTPGLLSGFIMSGVSWAGFVLIVRDSRKKHSS